MSESARIGLQRENGDIISVGVILDGCICHIGYYLSEIYNTNESIQKLIEAGDIYRILDNGRTIIYLDKISHRKDKLPKVSNNIECYIELCKSNHVDVGYLFTLENKWVIVAGFCVGELVKKC